MNIQFGAVTFSCLPFIYLSCSAAGMFSSSFNRGNIVHLVAECFVKVIYLEPLVA